MALNFETLVASKRYTSDTVIGLGAIKGAPCTVKKVVEGDEYTTITLGWTGTDGTERSQEMKVKAGPQGTAGTSISALEVDDNLHLKVTLSDGSVVDAGRIDAPAMEADYQESTKTLELNSVGYISEGGRVTNVNYDEGEKKLVFDSVGYLKTPASATNIGVVKVDGDTITADADGTIHSIGGGGGGTTDYSALSNKPKINNVTLSGNKSLADLGINNFDGNYNSLTNKPAIPTTSDIDTEVATYWNAHKTELKGDKGDKGDTGATYTITSADYDEIATVVYDMLTNAEEQEV